MNNPAEKETLTIKRATTPIELNKIYRFRYQVYAEHMGYNFSTKNGKVIFDEFDQTAANFYMEKHNELIGIIRVNILDPDKVDDAFEQTFSIRKFKDEYKKVLYTSKLMLHPNHRKFNYLTMLCEAVNAYSREMKIKLNIIECRPELLPLYKFMGFKEHHQPYFDSLFGVMIPLMLVADKQ